MTTTAPTRTCVACAQPLPDAAAHNPNGPDWDHHPTCKPPTHCPCTTPFDQPHILTISYGRPKITNVHPLHTPPGGHPPDTANHTLRQLDLPKPTQWVLAGGTGVVLYQAETINYRYSINRPQQASGYHCPGCHQDFANPNIAAMHWIEHRDQQIHPTPATTLWTSCRHPSQIRSVITGRPLLTRAADGIWQLDRIALWPRGILPTVHHSDWRHTPWKFGTGANR